MSQDLVIKTTARLQEASEPDRHRPIIRIDDREGRTTLSHISDANELANTIRASIDSGRDNPFRPDGEIYRMTDPIVDFYKLGPNRSGTQTPTYADLSESAGGAKLKSDKKAKRSLLWKRRAPPPADEPQQKHGEQLEMEAGKRSCWRKWLCCCCYCFCKGAASHSAAPTQVKENGRLSENIDHYNTATAAQGPKSQDLIISNSTKPDKASQRRTDDNLTTNWDSNSPAAIKTHNHNEAPPATLAIKQTKVVIVDELPSGPARNTKTESSPNQFSTQNNVGATNGTSRRAGEAEGASRKVAPTSTSSKCVVS